MVTPKKPAARRSRHGASSKKPPARGHRPAHEPTDGGRRTVAVMVVAGIEQEMIAECVGISVKTLRRHYGHELRTSYARIKADIAGNLINRARGVRANAETGQPEVPGDLKAMKFYLETHGWVRSERLLVKDDGRSDDADLSNLSDAEIEERLAKLRRSASVIRAKRKPKS